jgi:hypothetical protein
MSAMGPRGIEDELIALLDGEERATAPHDALEAVRSRVSATGQRSGSIFWHGPALGSQRSTGRMAALSVAGVVVAIGVALVASGSPQPDQLAGLPTPPPSPIASRGFEIGSTIELGIAPRSVAAGLGSIWVAGSNETDQTDGHLLRVDPNTRRVTRLPTSFTECDWGSNEWDWPRIAFGAGSLWMPDCAPGDMLRVDPRTGAIEARFQSVAVTSARPGALITFDGGSAWLVENATTGKIVRLDTATNTTTPFVTLGTPVTAIQADGTSLWIAEPSSIAHVDVATRKVSVTPMTGTLDAMTVVDHRAWAWLADPEDRDRTVVVVDPARRIVASFTVGTRTPDHVILADGLLWIVSDRFTVMAVDATSRKVVASLPVDNGEGGLASDGDSVWVGLVHSKQLVEVAPRR